MPCLRNTGSTYRSSSTATGPQQKVEKFSATEDVYKRQVQDDQYKALYPDLMIAKLMNQSGTAIKNAVVAFAAWDENNLPVLIDTIGNGKYVVHCSMNGINLADGETMTDAGMQVDSQQAERGEIKSFKAIVVSYEDFDGNTWRNPLYDNWVKLYRCLLYTSRCV